MHWPYGQTLFINQLGRIRLLRRLVWHARLRVSHSPTRKVVHLNYFVNVLRTVFVQIRKRNSVQYWQTGDYTVGPLGVEQVGAS